MDIETKLEKLYNALSTAESILDNLNAEKNNFVHASQMIASKDYIEDDISGINKCFARIKFNWKNIDIDNFGE